MTLLSAASPSLDVRRFAAKQKLAVIPVHLGFGPTLACAIDSGELGLQGRESAIE